ncbi:integral membrane protein [Xylaria curta]|nr:integral membrane protein [Xylaria curta]
MAHSDPTRTPIAPPPPGQLSNFIDPPSQAWMPRIAIYTTLPLVVISLTLRICARVKLHCRLGWEDYLCLAAGVASVGTCGTMLALVINDVYGRHIWDVPLSVDTEAVVQKTFAITALYCLAAALTKLSLLFLFRRIFLPCTYSKIMMLSGILFTTISYSALFAAWVFYNVPHANDAGWSDIRFHIRIVTASSYISVALGALGSFTDLYVIFLPITLISQLQLSRSKKLGVSALFGTGLLAFGFSLASLISRVYMLQRDRRGLADNRPDDYWESMLPYALTVTEINLGILCACIPVAFPLFKDFSRMLTSTWSFPRWRSRKLPEPAASCSTANIDIEAKAQPGPSSVANGTLGTLLSFIGGFTRFQQQEHHHVADTDITDIGMLSYAEIGTTQTDYHSCLRYSLPDANDERQSW